MEISKKIKHELSNGNTNKAIEILLNLSNELNKEFKHEIILHSSRYKKTNADFYKGLLSNLETNREILKINNSLLSLIDRVENINSKKNTNIIIKDDFANLKILIKNIETSTNYHLKMINSWSKSIKFRDLNKKKLISKTYIDLDFFFTPSRINIDKNIRTTNCTITKLINSTDEHIILLGQPGAGKTTTIKRIVQNLITYPEKSKHQFPILIRLRELDNLKDELTVENILTSKILEILGIDINLTFDKKDIDTVNEIKKFIQKDKVIKKLMEGKKFNNNIESILQSAANLILLNTKEQKRLFNIYVAELIDSLNILILLDGFDELKLGFKHSVIKEFTNLSYQLSKSRIILTSRIGEIEKDIQNTIVYEVAPLSKNQIQKFIHKWVEDDLKAETFYKQLSKSTYSDTAMRPLTLAHLCAIYDRYNRIPDKPKSAYDKILNLLLEEWDAQRGINRTSKYSNFSTFEKKEFLSNLAYILSTCYQTTVFNRNILTDVYKKIYSKFNLPEKELEKVINELESHTGIFIQTGYNNYEFSHKSLQEYLTAIYILKLPNLPYWRDLTAIPNECAIVVTLSSNSSSYIKEFSYKIISQMIINKMPNINSYLSAFFERIILEKTNFDKNIDIASSILYLYTLKYLHDSTSNMNIFDKIFSQEYFIESMKKLTKIYAVIKDGGKVNLYRSDIKYFRDRPYIRDSIRHINSGSKILLIQQNNFNYNIEEYLPKFFFVNSLLWYKK